MSVKSHKSKVLRSSHQYLGEEMAAPLIEYLNAKVGGKKPDLVQKLFRAHVELMSGVNTHTWVVKIRNLLRKARLRPYFDVPLAQKGVRWSHNVRDDALVPLARRGLARVAVPKMVNDLDHLVYAWEPAGGGLKQALAITSLVELGRNGFFRRVRECARPGCVQPFFFSRFAHHAFCSKECERKHHRSSEEWKAGRREYMKRLRHQTKLRLEVAAKGAK
jgi:hypothetical protein